MRTIRFRAWNKTENKMEHEGHFHFDKDGLVGLEQGVNWWGRPNLIPMQFTGLLDKSGKEIYEGDIVKVADDYETYGMMAGEIREVYFLDGGFRLKPKDQRAHRGHWLDESEGFEIVGNIYENPGLLTLPSGDEKEIK